MGLSSCLPAISTIHCAVYFFYILRYSERRKPSLAAGLTAYAYHLGGDADGDFRRGVAAYRQTHRGL